MINEKTPFFHQLSLITIMKGPKIWKMIQIRERLIMPHKLCILDYINVLSFFVLDFCLLFLIEKENGARWFINEGRDRVLWRSENRRWSGSVEGYHK